MIYSKEQKPKMKPFRRSRLNRFWESNLNPITGHPTPYEGPGKVIDATAEVSPVKKPAFRLAI